MSDHMLTPELPTGFSAALTEDSLALGWFGSLSVHAQQALIDRARSLHSKEEMRAFVSQMGRDGPTL